MRNQAIQIVRSRRKPPRYSFVIPVYNEEEVLPLLVERIGELFCRLDGEAEAIFVDDGSRDGSVEHLRRSLEHEPRFRLIELSRNFGHPAVLVGWLGLPPALPIVLTSLLVPVVNFILLSRWVFAGRERR